MNPITVFLTVACLAVGAAQDAAPRPASLPAVLNSFGRYLYGLAFVQPRRFRQPIRASRRTSL